MLCRRRKSFANALEPSSRAGARRGPKHLRAPAANSSTMPATSGASGPMIVNSTRSERASATNAAMSSAATSTLRTFGSAAVPAFPGATSTCATLGDAAHFHASACSRPPQPTIKTFIGSALMAEMPRAGEHHRHAVLVRGGDDFRVPLRAAGLDHGADAVVRGHIHAVAEWEEGIGGHGGAFDLELLVRRLHRGDAAGIDAAHLSGADADRGAVARKQDGVGLHELAHPPGEQQVGELRLGRLAPGDDAQAGGCLDAARVPRLR